MKLMPMKQFTTLCADIRSSTTSLRGKVQSAAITAIGYILQHGDVGAANRLVESVADLKTIRRDSLTAYVEKFSPVAYMTRDKKFQLHRERRDGEFKDVTFDNEYVELLNANPWYDAKKEPEPMSILDVDAEVDKFLKRIKKLASEPNVSVKDKQLIAEIEAVQGRYNMAKTLGTSQATLARLQQEIEAENAEIEAKRKAAAEASQQPGLPPLQLAS